MLNADQSLKKIMNLLMMSEKRWDEADLNSMIEKDILSVLKTGEFYILKLKRLSTVTGRTNDVRFELIRIDRNSITSVRSYPALKGYYRLKKVKSTMLRLSLWPVSVEIRHVPKSYAVTLAD